MTNIERYAAIHDEIMNRLETGNITIEKADDVIELAFNKYIVENAVIDCEIEIEKALLTSEYCMDMSCLYMESDDNDFDYFMEAGSNIFKSIKKAIEKAIETIRKCIEKIQEVITGKKVNKLQKAYYKAVKNMPSLKDVKIEYKDFNDIIKEREKSIKKIKKHADKDIDNLIKKEKERIAEMKPVTKAITIGSAFTLLAGTGGVLIKRYKDKVKELEDQLSKANERAEQFKKDKDEVSKFWRSKIPSIRRQAIKDHKLDERRKVNKRYAEPAGKMADDLFDIMRETNKSENPERRNHLWDLSQIAYDVHCATVTSTNLSEFAGSVISSINRILAKFNSDTAEKNSEILMTAGQQNIIDIVNDEI